MDQSSKNALFFVARITAAEIRRNQYRNAETDGEKVEIKAINKMVKGAENEIARAGSEFLRANGFTSTGNKRKNRLKKSQIPVTPDFVIK